MLADLIIANDMHDGVYAEPFAGGAGAAVELLKREIVSHIVINDLHYPIFAFWKAAVYDSDRFIERLMSVPVTIVEWEKARRVYRKSDRRQMFETGFATFFLNRCNRSGIISGGGPIGGFDQKGAYKLNARFNRIGLSDRLRTLARFSGCVTITNKDALDFLRRPPAIARGSFIYLDPPYIGKGPDLYFRGFGQSRHKALAELLWKPTPYRWVLTYDNAPTIRALYRGFTRCKLSLGYSVAKRGSGTELMIFDPRLKVPSVAVDNYRDGGRVRILRFDRMATASKARA